MNEDFYPALRRPLPKWATKVFLALYIPPGRTADWRRNSPEIPCKMGEYDRFAVQGTAMTQPPAVGGDTQLQNLIDRGLNGDTAAHEALLHHACDRLLRLTRKMFHGYPNLRRWEQTDDVFQNAMLRLHRALAEVRVESVRHFFNLAAVQVRRELLDLAKHHFGPEGAGANHHTDGQPADDDGGSLHDNAEEPEDLSSWSEFHAQVEKLPEDELEVVNLLYYEGLTQEEAAKVLGISFRTLKRRWQSARLKLHEVLNRDGKG